MLQSHSRSCRRENGNTHFGSVLKAWISLFAHSPKSRIAFKTQTGQSPKTHSPTRWWSQFEVIKQSMICLVTYLTFLTKLIDICGQQQQQALLKLELAATVDAKEPFVKATYNLEGDGPLALRVFQELRTVGGLGMTSR